MFSRKLSGRLLKHTLVATDVAQRGRPVSFALRDPCPSPARNAKTASHPLSKSRESRRAGMPLDLESDYGEDSAPETSPSTQQQKAPASGPNLGNDEIIDQGDDNEGDFVRATFTHPQRPPLTSASRACNAGCTSKSFLRLIKRQTWPRGVANLNRRCGRPTEPRSQPDSATRPSDRPKQPP
ncbi:hypothetical protein BDZ88DRAFT_34106 [Geranomyces variabilis]|nr:hypothetical protein BDZ88DRAFT_34106 [Geranomyces variabilis]